MVRHLSFWKSFQQDTNNIEIIDKLDPIGPVDEVMRKLDVIPYLHQLPRTFKDILNDPALIRYNWHCDSGMFLYFYIEDSNSKKESEVMVIRARGCLSERALLSFYVLLFEHLELVMLDEKTHKFISIKDLRESLEY